MRFSGSLISSFVLLAAGAAQAASSWSFDEGSIVVSSKKAVDAGAKEKFGPKSPLKTAVTLGAQDAVTISLTAKDNGKAKRPHQAFVLLTDEDTGLEMQYALSVKDSGKGSVKITQKDIPVQLLLSSKPVHATIVIASFGSAEGIVAPVFDLDLQLDPNSPAPAYPSPVRYAKKPEIHHIFRVGDTSPNKVFSLTFMTLSLAFIPVLFVTWVANGANLEHLPKAIGAAPLSHATFFGSIVAMEYVYFLYHTSWNLFEVLPLMIVFGTTTVLSGMKALGEVQSRRLAGER